MKRLAALFISASVIAFAPTHVFGKMKAAVDASSIISMLSSTYDKGDFTGVYGTTIYNVKSDKVKVAVDNAKGERVFEHVYACEFNNDEEHPACYIDTEKSGKPAPYAVKPGEHVFRIFVGSEEVYTLKYKLSVKIEYGYKNVYLTGDWKNIASISPGNVVYLTIFSGDPESCAAGGDNDAQALVYKDGEYLAKGHTSPGYSPNCSTTGADFTLFKEDPDHFTKWLTPSELLLTDGSYEVRYFEKKKLTRTYAFTVKDSKIISSPSAANPVQDALLAETLGTPYQSTSWIYAK